MNFLQTVCVCVKERTVNFLQTVCVVCGERARTVNFLQTVCVCVCVCVCGHVYVVYEDTNLYNDMGMTQVLQGEGDL